MRGSSVYRKIVASHALTLIAATVVSGLICYYLVGEFLRANVAREMRQSASIVEKLIDEDLSRGALYSRLLAENFKLKNALGAAEGGALARVLAEEMKTVSADFISAADDRGIVFAHVDRRGAGYEEDRMRRGEPLFLSRVFQKCQASGKHAVGIEVIYPNTVAVVALSPVKTAAGAAAWLRIGYRLDNDFAERIKEITGADVVLRSRGEIPASTIDTGDTIFGDTAWEKIKRDNILHSRRLKNSRVELLTAIPRSEITSVQRKGLLLICAIAAAILAASVFLSVPLALRIVKPLSALMKGVEEVEKGNMDYSLPPGGSDEVGALTESFRRMMEAIRARERELRKTNRQIIETGKLAAVGELAAGVAHEIGNPVAAISGYLQLMQTEQVDERAKHFIREMRREVEYIDTIIRELLDFARPSDPLEEGVELNEIIDDAFRILSHHPALRKVRISRENQEERIMVRGSRKEMLQAVINVALNGAQAMPDGGPLRVGVARGAVESGIAGSTARIFFEDSGVGIKQADRDRIFEPFFTTKRSGTGLGMSITFRIMERHGGRVDVESEEDRGTRVALVFPMGGGEVKAS